MTTAERRLEELTAAVANMRDLQRQYFKTRDTRILTQARNAEREVDRILAEKDAPRQSTLFEEQQP